MLSPRIIEHLHVVEHVLAYFFAGFVGPAPDPLTLEHVEEAFGDILQAMQTVAWIIDLYGDAYWPIFERLEEELAARSARRQKLDDHLPQQARQRPTTPASMSRDVT